MYKVGQKVRITETGEVGKIFNHDEVGERVGNHGVWAVGDGESYSWYGTSELEPIKCGRPSSKTTKTEEIKKKDPKHEEVKRGRPKKELKVGQKVVWEGQETTIIDIKGHVYNLANGTWSIGKYIKLAKPKVGRPKKLRPGEFILTDDPKNFKLPKKEVLEWKPGKVWKTDDIQVTKTLERYIVSSGKYAIVVSKTPGYDGLTITTKNGITNFTFIGSKPEVVKALGELLIKCSEV
jgi:hypothetical protein